MFSAASGLNINKTKCEIMTVHDSDILLIDVIKVKNKIKNSGKISGNYNKQICR